MEPLYVHLAIWLIPVSKPNIQIQIETPFGKWQFHGSFSKYCELCLHMRKECLAMHIGIVDESCIGFLKERRLVPPIFPMQEDDAKDAAVILDLNLESTP